MTAGNLAVRAFAGCGQAEAALRAAGAGYAAGRASTPFTPSMIIAQLLLGALPLAFTAESP